MSRHTLGWKPRLDEDVSDADTVEMSQPNPRVAAPIDRRQDFRKPRNVAVTGVYGNRLISGTSTDVSEHGLFLKTPHAPPVGTPVQLGFEAEGEALRAEGHVRWVSVGPDGRTCGCGILVTSGIAPNTVCM